MTRGSTVSCRSSKGFRWLSAGWRDFWTRPASSLAYGIGVFLLSVAFVWTLVAFGRDYILFPALAGFMIVAPFLAIGLYEKSRAIEEGRQIAFGSMLLVRPRAGAQVFFAGLLLCLLMLLWMRAAVLLYALFFGVTPFPGLDHIVGMLFSTASGWMMLARRDGGRRLVRGLRLRRQRLLGADAPRPAC